MIKNEDAPTFTERRLTIDEVKARLLQARQELDDPAFKAGIGVTHWIKWDQVGKRVEGTLVKHLRDIKGRYNTCDILHLKDGETTQGIRCTTRLQRIIRENLAIGTITVGKSRLRIVFTGTEPCRDPSKATKLFEVVLLEPVPIRRSPAIPSTVIEEVTRTPIDIGGAFADLVDGKGAA
jgi:hypothetical protein